MMIYYNKNNVVCRDAQIGDIIPIAKNMRRADREEIMASNNHAPKDALEEGYNKSDHCLTIEYKGEPIAMFGVVPNPLSASHAAVWLLGTPKIKTIRATFVKASRFFMAMLLDYYPYLYNFVDARNKDSIEWLKWCRAEFKAPTNYGVANIPFVLFTIRRESYV